MQLDDVADAQEPSHERPVTVHARFRLDQVNRSRGYYCPEPGAETAAVEAAYVELGAVKGEPFGSASPSGSFKMLIVNPAAARAFFDAPIGQEFDILISAVPRPK
jgi:hypothetical protein